MARKSGQRGDPTLNGKNVWRPDEASTWYYKFEVNKQPYHGPCNTTNKQKAEKFVRDLKAEKKVGARKDRDIGLGPMQFGAACDVWWNEEGCTNVETGLKYRLDWLRQQVGENRLLKDITPEDITAIRIARSKCVRADGKGGKSNQRYRSLKPNAVKATLVTLRTVINYAGKAKGAAVRMFDWPTWIKQDDEDFDVRTMSDTEQAAIWSELDDDVREVMDFDLRCGKRINEILPLTWPQIDPDGSMRIKIKGRNRPIISPLGKALMGRLQRLKARKLHETVVFTFVAQRTREYNGQPYVAGKRYPMKYSYLEKRWREACERAGITDLNIHCVRHTAATRLYRATGDIYRISEMLNHRDIATTKRYYMRTDPDVVREATDVLDLHEQKKVSKKVSNVLRAV